jgi:hypothetical protein
MRYSALIALPLAALLAACASDAPRRPGPLPPYAAHDRITEEAVRADFAAIDATQTRLALVNRDGRVPTSNYAWAKAQCWLDMARLNYHEGDSGGVIEEAMGEADRLLRALESGATPERRTPLIGGAARLREDLWRRADALAQGPACVADRAACLEVQLVWMGHEYAEGGWRHANPYIGIAERMADAAEREAAACGGVARR